MRLRKTVARVQESGVVRLAVIPGDGIGPEITAATLHVAREVDKLLSLGLTFEEVPIGFEALKKHGTTIREVHSFTWREVEPRLYEARITADAFCWNMVRALVATCLTVGEGRRAPQWPEELLLLDARSAEVPLAPARGLTLVGVRYPENRDLAARAEATRATREM